MMLLAAVLVLSGPIVFTPDAEDREQIVKQYATQCSGAKAVTPACKTMQWQVERFLYDDLRAGAATTHETFEVAAAADYPLLAVLGLKRLGDGFTKNDDDIIAMQVESPFADVRNAAFDLVGRMSADHWTRMLLRRKTGDSSEFPHEDEIPSVTRLGAAVYPGATYRYFASERKRAFFTTDDSPEKAVAFYVKAGLKAWTPDELKAEQKKRDDAGKAAQKDSMATAAKMQAAMMAAMAAGKDPQAAMMEIATGMTGGDTNWTRGLITDEGVVKPKVLPLDSTYQHMMVIFRDDILGATAIVFLEVQTAEEMALMKMSTSSKKEDVARMKQFSAAQSLLNRPLVDAGK
jgi:hypothetical protein